MARTESGTMTKDEAIAYLASIGEALGTQDNGGSADVIWMVEERVSYGPIDESWHYADAIEWIREGEPVCEDKATAMEKRWQKGREHLIPEYYSRCPVKYHWEIRQPFFLKENAIWYRDTQGHRHSGPLRITADSAYRNPEWKRMREALAALV